MYYEKSSIQKRRLKIRFKKTKVLLNKIGKRNFVNSLYLHTKFVHMMISYTS